MHQLRQVQTAEDCRAMHAIRRGTLFAPGRHAIEYDENHPDDRANGNVPFLLFFDSRPIGVVRLDSRGAVGIVRLVAIRPDQQRMGHGRAMSELVEAEAARLGVAELRVNAAPDAVGFYERTGWKRRSWDPTELVGIAANSVQMIKAI